MPLFKVCLGRLIRQEKVIVLEAESVEDIDLHQLYEDDNGFDKSDLYPDGWEDDVDWGTEEGTHIVVDEDGEVVKD